MRAWRVERPGEPSEVLRLIDVPIPEPGPARSVSE
jgi:NADPH:quinone reductase